MTTTNKSIITFFLLCMAGNSLVGQKDSLLSILENEEKIEAKMKIAGKLYWTYLYKDIDFSDSITNYGIKIANTSKNDSLRCVSLHMKANVKLVKSEYDSSLYFVQRKRKIASKNNFTAMIGSCYSQEGLLHYYKGEFNESLEKHFAALEIQKKHSNQSKQLKTLSNIGISYERLDEYEKAISYYNQALEITPESDTYSKASLHSNIGGALTNSGNYQEAKISLLMAKQLVTADDDLSLINDVDNGLAKVLKETGELDEAMTIAQQIQKRAVESKDIFRQVRMLDFIGSIHMEKADYPKAIGQYEEALDIGSKTDVGESSLNIYQNLKIAYQALGKEELALMAADSVITLKQSLFDAEKREITEELDLKYQTAIKDRQIQEANQANLAKTNQRNIAISGLLLLLAGGAFFWQRMKSKQLAQEQKEILQQKKIENLEKEHKLLSMSAMLEGEEKERYRIAQDLHDGLGSLLASVKAHYSIIQGEIKQLEKLNVFEKAQNMMDDACNEVRRISHNLMPPILNSQGLPSALQNLVTDYKLTHKLDIAIDIQKMEERMTTNKEIILYRVCQELLNNIHKHAEATKIEVSLYGLAENIQLIVEDDGKGFDINKVSPGLGLMSLQSRIDFVGGHVDIDSRENEGTTISISIPK